MNPLWGHFVGIFILLMMAVFIGIWIWAWHGSHRPVFNRMARLPMLDDWDQETPAPARAAHEAHRRRMPAASPAPIAPNAEGRP